MCGVGGRSNIAMQMSEIYGLITRVVLVVFGAVVALGHCLIGMAAKILFRLEVGVDEEFQFSNLD